MSRNANGGAPVPEGGWLDGEQQRAWLAYIRVQLRLTYEMNRQLQSDSDLSHEIRDGREQPRDDETADGRYQTKLHKPSSWPAQARLLQQGGNPLGQIEMLEDFTGDTVAAFAILGRALGSWFSAL